MKSKLQLSFPLKSSLLALVAGMASISCAQNGTKKEVQKELQNQPPVASDEVYDESKEVIFDSPSLSHQQRQALKKVYRGMTVETAKIRRDIGRHQVVLVKNLVNERSNPREIEILKNRILDLEKRRTQVWLNALNRAEKILDRRTAEDEDLYRAFIQKSIHGPTNDTFNSDAFSNNSFN